MPPFSFTLDEGSSRLKKPCKWQRVLLKVSGEALAGDHRENIDPKVQIVFRMSEVAEPYIRRRALRHLEKGRVVIFAAGTGNPFFTTDTAAALRCAEINAEVVLKVTNVDGVYDADPKHNPNASLLETVSYHEVTTRDLSKTNIPFVVFNLQKPGNVAKAIVGEKVGTFIGCTRNQEQNGNALGEERRLVNEV
ncbi:hypothetical protein SETIT_5G464500v2 [Setaria italica]|uniref:Uridylate kinase n=1 Tax=Setaria italica TaxID=4555 RepID=A0A368RGD1_SETIT|nr:hypothetical protein SETIT_5G464500v2 [Setaria italica]